MANIVMVFIEVHHKRPQTLAFQRFAFGALFFCVEAPKRSEVRETRAFPAFRMAEHNVTQNAHNGPGPPGAIRADLVGWARCSALGVTAAGYSPFCALARKLILQGVDPGAPLEAYRDGALALRAPSLAAAARLTVCDDIRGTPRLVQYRPPAHGVASPRQKKEETAVVPPG